MYLIPAVRSVERQSVQDSVEQPQGQQELMLKVRLEQRDGQPEQLG